MVALPKGNYKVKLVSTKLHGNQYGSFIKCTYMVVDDNKKAGLKFSNKIRVK